MSSPAKLVSASGLRYRKVRDRLIEALLLAAGLVAVFTTLAIVAILLYESSTFFAHVSIVEFLTDTMWTPLFADAHYGILPLVAGTVTTTMVALLVAVPLGTTIAIYLSEFAPHHVRESVKPILELLGAVPTVVYGYFALTMVTPVLQWFMSELMRAAANSHEAGSQYLSLEQEQLLAANSRLLACFYLLLNGRSSPEIIERMLWVAGHTACQ